YAIGYKNSKSCRSYKILRFADSISKSFVVYQLYDLNSNSWSVFDVPSDWYTQDDARGVSVKGNTYWSAKEKYLSMGEMAHFLICFDFTRGKFGRRLPLPFQFDRIGGTHWDEDLEIWVTVKIEPGTVSWNKFGVTAAGSFFIHQENKLAVLFNKGKYHKVKTPRRNTAYIIGEDGYFRKLDLGEETSEIHDCPLDCSYVPSSVQIKQRGKKKKKKKKSEEKGGT
ncbi:hypothetical protein CARUB_v10015266mg, partial [Capsella rubella]